MDLQQESLPPRQGSVYWITVSGCCVPSVISAHVFPKTVESVRDDFRNVVPIRLRSPDLHRGSAYRDMCQWVRASRCLTQLHSLVWVTSRFGQCSRIVQLRLARYRLESLRPILVHAQTTLAE
jgi:hypothetical protein